MKILEKIKSKNILPFLLFMIVLINYLPLIKNNIVTKNSVAVTTSQMTICFVIELIILFLFFIKKIKINKLTIINFGLLVLTTIALLIVQVNNYNSGNYKIFDFINIGCIFANILFLFIFMLNINIDEKYIYTFYKCMVFFGIAACIVNIVLYKDEILASFTDNEKFNAIKGFFAHRNQLAMFLYVTTICDMFLVLKHNKNILYKIVLVLFLANVLFTASRTALLCIGIFAVLFFITTDRFPFIVKLIIIVVGIEALLTGAYFLSIKSPEKMENMKMVFIRENTLSSFNGRTDIWKRGIDFISENNQTKLFGKGRFLGSDIFDYYEFINQFHSFYIEALVAGGIMELTFFLSLYFTVIIKVMISGMEKKYKSIYIAMFISYFVYCIFESLSRFSIGCVDTLCLIVFITIPLLHANSVERVKKYKVSKSWLLDEKNIVIESETKEVNVENEKNKGDI